MKKRAAIILALLMFFAFCPTALANSVVGSWPLASDATGIDNGTVHGGVSFNGSAAHFDSTGYIEVPDKDYFSPSTFAQHMTLAFWINPDNYTFAGEDAEGYIHILGKGEWNTAPNYEWMFRLYNHDAFDQFPRPERLSFYVFNQGGLGAASEQDYAAPSGKWTYIAGEVDDTVTKFYINGAKVDEDLLSEYNIQMSNTNAPLRIGMVTGDDEPAPFRFQGWLKQLKIYDYSLTDAQILASYDAGKPALGLSIVGTYWATYADYLMNHLSQQIRLTNNGTTTSYNTTLVSAVCTNGVIQFSPVDAVNLGTLDPGGSNTAVIMFAIPPSVTGFRATYYGSAMDTAYTTYYYPGPWGT